MQFSRDFMFGVATSAYQIEGAYNTDGRTMSIWDTYCRTSGRVINMDNGDIACDHYNRYEEDVKIIDELDVDAYRFSIAWPRIFPKKGEYNPKGMDFYKRLLKELKAKGVKTCATLYHWDLPMWAFEEGGFINRESVDWFLEYAKKCFEELDDMVDMWITHNEPWCASFLSYQIGGQAPGHQSVKEALMVAHHLLLSHGKTVKMYKSQGGKKPIGITLNLSPTYAKTNSNLDKLAASNADGFLNRWFLNPLFKGEYPYDMLNLFHSHIDNYDFIINGDLKDISAECDFLGINYYMKELDEYENNDFLHNKAIYSGNKKTYMGWEISPREFIDLIQMIRDKYTNLPIYITENGSAWNDLLEGDKIHDKERVEYLTDHLQAVSDMNDRGLNVKGYFAWSLMDNFEWSYGYDKRFGLVYVDYKTLKRYKKDSYFKYRDIIKEKNTY